MSMRYPGGLIAPTPVNQQYPSGVWTGPQSAPYQANNVWGNDSSFKNTTLLLHGDGATTPFIKDASTNNFQITLNGDTKPNNLTPFITNGYWSNYFDGSGDYLNVTGSALDASTTTDYTVEFWMYTAKTASAQMIYELGTGVTNDLQIYVSTTALVFQVDGNSPTATVSFTDNSWVHVACVKAGGTLTTYINGFGTTVDTGVTVTSKTTAYIGMRAGTSLPFTGYLSNMRVTRSAVYTSNFTPSTIPLTAIANTALLTCQSNRFVDNSASPLTITANGNTAVYMQQPFTAPSGTSLFGSGYFDGSGDYLRVPTGYLTSVTTGNFTVEGWWNFGDFTTRTTYFQRLWSFGTGLANDVTLNVSNSGNLVFRVNDSIIASQSSGAMSLNSWNHVALVRSSGTVTIYLNGTSVASAANSSNISGQAGNSFYLGCESDGAGGYFYGYCSNVRITNTAVYTTTFTPSTTPLTPVSGTSLLTLQTNGPENNNGFLDSSYNSFPVTRNGNTTQGAFTPYGANWSNYFGGAGNYMTTPSGSASTIVGTINSSLNLCIECWVYLNEYSGSSTFPALIGNMDPTTQSDDWSFGPVSTGALMFYWFDGSQKRAYTTSTIPLGAWTHTAVNISAGVITLFINGVSQTLTGNTTLTTALVGRNYLTLGQWNNGSGSDFGFFKGYVSNLRVIKASTYTANFTPSTAPLTAVTNTSLLICQSNRFVDNSANAFALTASGPPSVQRFAPFAPTVQYTPSTLGGSGYFDGSGDWLETSLRATTFGSSNFTIECWLYYQGDGRIYANYRSDPGNVNGTELLMSGTDIYFPLYQANTNPALLLQVAHGMVLNTWNHIAVTRSGSTFTMWVNGVSKTTGTYAPALNAPDATVTYIGRRNWQGNTNYLTGYLSNFRVVIGTAVYTSAFTPPTAPLTPIANTSLLMSYANAAIFDNSGMNNLETVGNAQIDTSVVKYGTSSMYFDGSGDYLLAKSNDVFNFGTGDFTVEFWINASASGSYTQTIGTLVSGTEAGTWRVGNRYNGLNQIYFARGTGSGFNEFQANVNVNDGAWHHVTVVRYSGTVTIYADGVARASSSITGTCTSSNPLYLGYNGRDNAYITGYLDDVRVTKGVARYITNFTPPVARMPNQ